MVIGILEQKLSSKNTVECKNGSEERPAGTYGHHESFLHQISVGQQLAMVGAAQNALDNQEMQKVTTGES